MLQTGNLYVSYLLDKIKLKKKQLESLTSIVNHYDPNTTKLMNNQWQELCKKYNINDTEYSDFMQYFYKNPEPASVNLSLYDIIDSVLKPIYKKLVLATHSDKNIKNIEENTTNDTTNKDFIDCKEAYDNKDYLKLIELANKYMVKIDNVDEILLITILEKSLYSLNEKIKKIKLSVEYRLIITDDLTYSAQIMEKNIRMYKEAQMLLKEKERLEKQVEQLKSKKIV